MKRNPMIRTGNVVWPDPDLDLIYRNITKIYILLKLIAQAPAVFTPAGKAPRTHRI
jgi:hypothetical protein